MPPASTYNPADPLTDATPDEQSIPALARRCWQQWRTATQDLRMEEKLRLQFYAGGELQWKQEELNKRRNSNRPWVTVNRCKPAVDQIEGDIRQNPPGPQAFPVDAATDGDLTDIIEGLIRETEYRSHAQTAYSTAGKYAAASGYGVLELATEYVDEASFSQRLVILPVEDPSIVFFDPHARMPNRQDAMWAGKLKMYSRDAYIAEFGKSRLVLKDRMAWRAAGWILDAFGMQSELTTINEWTGDGKEGPFFVCEFYRVVMEPTTLRLYSDNIARFDDEPVPAGVSRKKGDGYARAVGRKRIYKYVVDALEELKPKTQWLGKLIPLFPVLGPEIYIDGKLYRGSVISNAIDPQRALNYVATTATELAGLMPKAPFIGPKGSFDDPRWQTANSEVWAYLEYTPTWVTSETTGQQELAAPPQRNMWETPIQWLLALGAWFSDQIKAVTSIYDPSLGQAKTDQSGRAIAQLRSESSTGTFSYSDNLHRAIALMYSEMCVIFPKILSGPRAQAIVRANSQHEVVELNRVFEGGIDPDTGKPGKTNDITLGLFSARVTAGPNFETRQLEAVQALTEFFKAAPQTLAIPGVAASFLRMIGEGNPEVEGMADLLQPPQDGQATPAQMQQQLATVQQQNQALQMLVQKMQAAMAAKLPDLQLRKWETEFNGLVKLLTAKITASKDMDSADADRQTSLIETQLGLAHELGLTAMEHEHQQAMADKNAAIASAQSAQDAAQTQPQETDQ